MEITQPEAFEGLEEIVSQEEAMDLTARYEGVALAWARRLVGSELVSTLSKTENANHTLFQQALARRIGWQVFPFRNLRRTSGGGYTRSTGSARNQIDLLSADEMARYRVALASEAFDFLSAAYQGETGEPLKRPGSTVKKKDESLEVILDKYPTRRFEGF